jgi:hypothetical protein
VAERQAQGFDAYSVGTDMLRFALVAAMLMSLSGCLAGAVVGAAVDVTGAVVGAGGHSR